MACKYCQQYIERAYKEVEDFEKVCKILRLDPAKKSDWEAIVTGLVAVGQFGTIRLARQFDFVTDEEDFRLAALVGLHFYWMVLDFWEEQDEQRLKEQAASNK